MSEMTRNANVNDSEVKVDQLEKADLSDEYIFNEALRIIEESERRGIILRLIGSTAYVTHCPKHRDLFKEIKRKLTDVDLMTYSTTPHTKLKQLFQGLGYELIKHLAWHATGRDIFVNKEKLYVDVFRDVLPYCHKISFIGRLELDNPTISLVDLLLGKLQVVEINEKDLKDMSILLLEHEIGYGDPERIDAGYLAHCWASDWGFYHTGMTNLDKLYNLVVDFGVFNDGDLNIIRARIRELQDSVNKEPKTVKWKVRSMIGTRIRWYEPVESVER